MFEQEPDVSSRYHNDRTCTGVLISSNFECVGPCDTWRSFSFWRIFQILKSDTQAKMTAKCPTDLDIQKITSRHPCGQFDTFVTNMAQTVQKLEQFETLTFEAPWIAKICGSVPRFGPHTLHRPKRFTNRTAWCKDPEIPHMFFLLVILTSCASSKYVVFFFPVNWTLLCFAVFVRDIIYVFVWTYTA